MRGGGIFLMEGLDLCFGVFKVFGRFPGVGASAIAFPMYLVLELASEYAAIEDTIDFVLLFAGDFDGLGQRGLIDSLIVPGAEPVHVEHRVDLEPMQ